MWIQCVFPKYLFCGLLCRITLFGPDDTREHLLLASFYRVENQGPEKQSNLPKATQPVCGRAGIQTQAVGLLGGLLVASPASLSGANTPGLLPEQVTVAVGVLDLSYPILHGGQAPLPCPPPKTDQRLAWEEQLSFVYCRVWSACHGCFCEPAFHIRVPSGKERGLGGVTCDEVGWL